jgi:hypothetical protein
MEQPQETLLLQVVVVVLLIQLPLHLAVQVVAVEKTLHHQAHQAFLVKVTLAVMVLVQAMQGLEVVAVVLEQLDSIVLQIEVLMVALE